MNSSEMLRLIDSISRERNVDKDALFADIEQAMVSAARKHFNTEGTEEFRSEVDRLTGQIRLWHEEEEIDLAELGRIPAQTAKQVMIQRFREDERSSIYNEFADRVGELVTGMAQRYEGGALVAQIGRAEGFMPRSEQIPGEQHQAGERVRCLILDVRESGNQVKIVLSRASTEFIRRLFEVEVPEVSERIIEIKAMSREPGHRTKIAVSSIDSKVDAVGACVGVRGSRIKNIVDELGGEKIDIVRWNESSQILIQNALKPAEVVEISLCFELGRATVVVADDQLSLAIGKRGQNVRLAARLTNWDIDILTPPEYTKNLDAMETCLRTVEGMDDTTIDKLAALGVISVFDIEEVGGEYLAEQLAIESELAEKMVDASIERGKTLSEEQAKEKDAAAKRKASEQDEISSMPGAAQAAAILGDLVTPAPETAPESTPESISENAPEDEAAPTEEAAGEAEVTAEVEEEAEEAPKTPETPAADEGGSIVDMLEKQHEDAATGEAEASEEEKAE
ncbi:hypothetical protein KS4_09740 [Poriferisphaera corsica]|uniref:Transcription termination/antitermination protein NusA n=1 Tax=Poriferisphaera corsica TaxID=2528020 RepID=A0A517YRU1_9BACT|nr:transcription termination factor NusA [Poriferisphaera corsica]QDU32935.1 hypothetical protein KS4_09740 [Poriferisphaera corsica]